MVLHLEKESREELKSGQKAERELKSSEIEIKPPQKQLATQKTENAQMYSLKFAVSQSGSYSTYQTLQAGRAIPAQSTLPSGL